MAQVDRTEGLVGNTAIKAPCACATTANITLNGEQTIDGVLTSGSRVLVKDQTTTTENGIWVSDSGAWSRAKDFNGARDVTQGTLITVYGGTTNNKTAWRLTTASPVIGTSALAFERGTLSVASEITADDGSSGSIFTTVQGFITKILSSTGSAIVGFIQAGTGALARFVQDKLRETLSVEDFANAGDPDDTLAFGRALVAGKAQFRKVILTKTAYSFSSKLTIDQVYVEGPGAGLCTMTYTGTGFAVETTSGQRGAGLMRVRLVSGASSQSGVLIGGSLGTKLDGLTIYGFDSGALQIGDTAAAKGNYWSRFSELRIDAPAAMNGAFGVKIDGGAVPSSNANYLDGVVIGGNYEKPLWIKGQNNVVSGGTIELTRPHENLVSLITIEGSGNTVRDMYLEPALTAGFGTAKVCTFGASSSHNEVTVWHQFLAPSNINSMISDTGRMNSYRGRASGGGFNLGKPRAAARNLVQNADFSIWRDANNPDGWMNGTARCTKDAVTVRSGAASILMTEAASKSTIDHYLNNYLVATSGRLPLSLSMLAGQDMVSGVFCKTSVAGAGGLKIWSISTAAGTVGYGAESHTGSDTWELLLAHHRVPTDVTRLWMELRSHPTNANITGEVRFSEPFFVFGDEPAIWTPGPISDSGGVMYGDLELFSVGSTSTDTAMINLGTNWLWVDPASGKLRIKTGARPTNLAADGTVVGTQT